MPWGKFPPLPRVRAAGKVAQLNTAFYLNSMTANALSAGRVLHAKHGFTANQVGTIMQQSAELRSTGCWINQ